jgi:tetratricopeptide (TPR) repeat protein
MSSAEQTRFRRSAEFYEDLVSFYREAAVAWGAIDLFLVGYAGSISRMGDYAAVYRAWAQNEAPMFGEICLVWPTADDEGAILDRIKARFAEVLAGLRGEPLTADELEHAFRPVRIVSPDTLEVESLSQVVRAAEPYSVLVVGRAGLYRSSRVNEPGSDLSMLGDTWAPHLLSLMEELRAPAAAAGCYVVVDAGEAAPSRPEFLESLLGVENTHVMYVRSTSENLGIVEYQRWRALVAEGNLESALAEIHASKKLPPEEKALVELQLYSDAGISYAVRGLLESSPDLLSHLAPEAALRVAMIAEAADADDVATELLRGAVSGLRVREHLELAVEVAGRIGHEALVGTAEQELHSRFPNSGALRRHRAAKLADEGRYGEAARLLEGDQTPNAEFWSLLAEYLETPDATEIQAFMQAVAERLPDWLEDARRAGARKLADEGRGEEALGLLLRDASHVAIDRADAFAVLDVVQRSAIQGIPISDSLLADAIERVVETLSLRPTDTTLRFRLLRTLSPEVLGHTGFASLAYVTISLAGRPMLVQEPRKDIPLDESLQEDDVTELFRRGCTWLKSLPHATIGSRAFPRELLGMAADQALVSLGAVAIRLAREFSGPRDKAALSAAVAMVSAIAPHTSEPDEDLLILRQIATWLAHTGHVQYARDWAEHVLALTRGDPLRARLAWTSFAEIYAHTGNTQEAIIAIACALAAHPGTTWEDLWYESQLIFRLFRDTGLLELAGPFLDLGREALEHMDQGARLSSRLETAELQAELWAYAHDRTHDADRLEAFTRRAAVNLQKVLESGDEAAPATMILASAMYLCEAQQVGIPPDAQRLLDSALQRLDPRMQVLVRMSRATAPDIEQFVSFSREIEPARYSEDIGYDIRRIVPLAKRLLAAEGRRDAAAGVYAVEALADQAIPLPGAAPGPSPRMRLVDSRDAPAQAACELAQANLSVIMMGVAEDRLVHVTAENGVLHAPVIEDEATFSLRRLWAWGEDYPYGYAGVNEGNVFYTSTDGIGLSVLPERAVIVASTELQGFPPNLLRVGEEFGGWERRLAAAPSLTWLHAARLSPFRGDGRKLSWIPTEGGGEWWQTLSMVAEQLRGTFSDHGVELSTAVSLPTDTTGADLAIVVAHGGVAEENRFFRVVSDDTDLKLTPAALAASLGGVGVVILFVCSGGRIDKHPDASAVLGMAKRLLAQGCRAVVAPPWPLETNVPPYWLPTFLTEWDRGVPVVDATFAANRAVWESFGFSPAKCLAMTVYGDPLITKTP